MEVRRRLTALLAILETGAAYLPLDPAYPADRLAFMVEDSQLRILVTRTGALPDTMATAGLALGSLDADAEAIAAGCHDRRGAPVAAGA